MLVLLLKIVIWFTRVERGRFWQSCQYLRGSSRVSRNVFSSNNLRKVFLPDDLSNPWISNPKSNPFRRMNDRRKWKTLVSRKSELKRAFLEITIFFAVKLFPPRFFPPQIFRLNVHYGNKPMCAEHFISCFSTKKTIVLRWALSWILQFK